MKYVRGLTAVAALAGALVMAAPASAAVTWTFATWTQQLNSGYPVSYNPSTKVLGGSGTNIISFTSITPLVALTNQLVDFTFSATAVGAVSAVPAAPGVFAQGLTGGHLVFSTAAIANLLTIDFTGGALWGSGNTWSIEATHGVSAMSFSSDVGSFAGLDPTLNAFNIGFNLRRAIAPHDGGALPAFTARLVGQAVVGGVPEPATWAMMLTGFAAMGGALRARRRQALAQA